MARNRTYLQLKAINSPYAARLPHDDSRDFAPRVGLAFDVTGVGRHVLRAGYGLYFGQVFLAVPVFMLQQANPILFGVTMGLSSAGPGDPNADLVPGTNLLLSQWRYGVDKFPGIPPASANFQGGEEGNLISPDYRNPFTQQFNVGYAFQLNSNNLLEVEYNHTLGLHESKTVDVNPKDPTLRGARPLNEIFGAHGLPTLSAVNMEMSIGRSRYDGLNISYRRSLSRHVRVSTHYVLSRALAYNGSAASFLSSPTDLNAWFAPHDLGPTPSDERHRWVTSAVIELPWGVRFAPLMQLASARPYNSAQGIDLFGTGHDNAHAILLKDRPLETAAEAYGQHPLVVAMLGATYASGGNVKQADEALELLDRLAAKRFVPHVCRALIHIAQQDRDKAFDELARAAEDRDAFLCWMNVYPGSESIRSDPRFAELFGEVGLLPADNEKGRGAS